MLNFGASKPRVKGGPGPRGPPWIRTWLHRFSCKGAFSRQNLIMLLFGQFGGTKSCGAQRKYVVKNSQTFIMQQSQSSIKIRLSFNSRFL